MRKKNTPYCSFYSPASSYGSCDDKCELCAKRFNSGHALGGHKDIIYEKLKHTCHVCNKVFSSNKALCGHMRLHSHKGFKGIHSPTTSSSLVQKLDVAPPAIDFSNYLPPKSHKTDKRRNIIHGEYLNGCDGHAPLQKKLKVSSNVDNDKIEKQISYIDETPANKVKDNNNNNDNCKKSLVLRFKIQPSSSKDNKKIWHCSQVASIDIKEKKKNIEGVETGREQGHNELKSERVVTNFDLNELPTKDVADE